jgi:hypothetical protein
LKNKIGAIQKKGNNKGNSLVGTYLDNYCVVLLGKIVNNKLARAQTHIGHTKHMLSWKNILSNASLSIGCEHCVHCSSKGKKEKGIGKGACNIGIDNRPRKGQYKARKQYGPISQHGEIGIE